MGQQQPINPQQQQRVPQMYPQQGYGRGMNKVPRPILGQQPPMPRMNLVLVNLVQGELLEQALVPTMSCGEEPSSLQWINPRDQSHQNLKNIILILM